ncbi:unnamed protein product [Absidia cylindrospora]
MRNYMELCQQIRVHCDMTGAYFHITHTDSDGIIINVLSQHCFHSIIKTGGLLISFNVTTYETEPSTKKRRQSREDRYKEILEARTPKNAPISKAKQRKKVQSPVPDQLQLQQALYNQGQELAKQQRHFRTQQQRQQNLHTILQNLHTILQHQPQVQDWITKV